MWGKKEEPRISGWAMPVDSNGNDINDKPYRIKDGKLSYLQDKDNPAAMIFVYADEECTQLTGSVDIKNQHYWSM